MKLTYDIDGTNSLRITDDKYHPELLMDYDEQLEQYQLAIRVGQDGEVEPLDPIRRREGETDETYFDRASAMATRIYLNRINDLIEEHSRYERMGPILAKIQDKLTHMELTCAHWDNNTPTEPELAVLSNLLSTLSNLDTTLTEVS